MEFLPSSANWSLLLQNSVFTTDNVKSTSTAHSSIISCWLQRNATNEFLSDISSPFANALSLSPLKKLWEREKAQHPLIYVSIVWFLYMPCLGIKSTTLACWGDTLTNCLLYFISEGKVLCLPKKLHFLVLIYVSSSIPVYLNIFLSTLSRHWQNPLTIGHHCTQICLLGC